MIAFQDVDRCLRRIAEREDEVRAWTVVDADGARRAAAANATGPLAGVPIGVKDIFDTADLPTGYGSPIFAGHRPDADAACVRALRDAGAIVLGKTTTTEFATYTPTVTRNPHDLARTPGGSSSGSAAAVADGMVPLALGTQTAGSTIRPAAYCGIVGFKPTHGRVDLSGCFGLSARLDTIGLFARDVVGVEALAAVLLGGGTGEAAVPGGAGLGGAPPRIALLRAPGWDRLEPAGREAVERAAAALDAAGARVTELPEPPGFAELPAAQELLQDHDAARSLRDLYDAHRDRFSDMLAAMIERGLRLGPDDVAAALAARDRGAAGIAPALEAHDAILAPAAAGEAPVGLDSTGDPYWCRPWTLLGAPAIALPAGAGPAGMPVGVQLVGRRGGDAALLATARWAEAALGVSPARAAPS